MIYRTYPVKRNEALEGLSRDLLIFTVPCNDFKKATVLLQNGADANYADEYGCTPLMQAKTQEMTHLLLTHGAKVNSFDHDGCTPLMQAAFNLRTKVVSVLLKAGATINAKDNHRNTPLMYALWGIQSGGDPETARLLVAHGADIHAKNAYGVTVRQFLQSGHITINPDLVFRPVKPKKSLIKPQKIRKN